MKSRFFTLFAWPEKVLNRFHSTRQSLSGSVLLETIHTRFTPRRFPHQKMPFFLSHRQEGFELTLHLVGGDVASSSTESVELLVTGTLTTSKQHLVLKKAGTRKGGIMEVSCSAMMDPHGPTLFGAKHICGSCRRMNSTGPIRSWKR